MTKGFILSLSAAVVLSSCGTYAGSGAMSGGSLGSILGGAIGGITGGARGSDIGTIVGMAGGAIIGAKMGQKADQRQREDVHDHYEKVQQRKARERRDRTGYDYNNQTDDYIQPNGVDSSGFDNTNSGDDRIYNFQDSDVTNNSNLAQPNKTTPKEISVDRLAATYQNAPRIELSNVRFEDENHDGLLSRNEAGKIVFDVTNHGESVINNLRPSVMETTGNVNVIVNPSGPIERIEPGKTISYTIYIRGDKKLKNGVSQFALTILQGQKSICKVSNVSVNTSR